jgi:L-idonate 5-dehydrogenase
MQGVIIHAPKDLRIEPVAVVPPGRGEVRVAIQAGGICGSDLHYYNHGGTAAIRIREPMALGHEIAGTVAEVGERVEGLAPGTRVAVNPSYPAAAASTASGECGMNVSTCISSAARCGCPRSGRLPPEPDGES